MSQALLNRQDQYDAMWANTLMFPVYIAAASALILLIHVTLAWKPIRRLYVHISPPSSYNSLGEEPELLLNLRERNGGSVIYAYKLARAIGCFTLLGLSLATGARDLDLLDGWPQISIYIFASVLALLSVMAQPRFGQLVGKHLEFLLLFTLGVYCYRDVYPLLTFTLAPRDASEGVLLWSKIAVLVATGVIIPLAVPQQYVPVDSKNPSVPTPEQTSSIFSRVVYTYLDPIILVAYKTPHLAHDHLPPLADDDHAEYLKEKAFPYIHKTKGHIFFGLLRFFRKDYVVLTFMIIIKVLAAFISPVGINRLLHYMETKEEGGVRPWVWIMLLLVGPMTGSIAFQWYMYIATRCLVRTQCLIQQLVFEHSLRIRIKAETDETDSKTAEIDTPSNVPPLVDVEDDVAESTISTEDQTLLADDTSSRKGTATPTPAPRHATADNLVGKINNLVTTDLGNIADACDFLVILILMPLQIVLCISFLYVILGWSAFVGLATLITLFPIPGYFTKRIQTVQQTRMKKTDARVGAVTEIMGLLRMVKYFGWEKKMNQRVVDKREEELVWVWKLQSLELLSSGFNFTVLMKKELNASVVFSSITVFDMLRQQLFISVRTIGQAVQGKVSLDRVNDFLRNTELLDVFSDKPEAGILAHDLQTSNLDAIGFRDASFTWSNDSDGTMTPARRNFVLKIEDELLFKHGSINLILGPTGSGKTSLLMALLGEMHFIPSGPTSWFNLPRGDGIAYAAQESWVLSETIRDNILFESRYDEERYKQVLYQCCLERDIALFEAGDKTEVGDKGLTLSGGQKARITLARAIYSPAKTLLLDDIFAALDVHTAKWILDKCFTSDLLKGRTVLLVTHNVALVRPIAHFVVSLGMDGRISDKGSITDVIAHDHKLAVEALKNQELLEKDAIDDTVDSPPVSQDPTADGKLVMEEEVETGHINWPDLKLFLTGLAGAHPVLFFAAYYGGLFVTQVFLASQTWYLGYWASQYEKRPGAEVSVAYYVTGYIYLMGTTITIYSFTCVVYIFGTLRASRSIHKQLMESVLGTTMRWLDVTPTSRVIARCTDDIRAIDGPISLFWTIVSELSVAMVIRLAAVVILTPIFIIPGILIFVAGALCGHIYIKAQLYAKREMSTAKAPVLSHFGAAISGLTSLRAYGAQESFILESQHRIDRYSQAARTFFNLNRWICIRIDAIGGMFSAGLAVYLVYGPAQTASNIGFSLNMAVMFTLMILEWVRFLNELEVQGNSLERINAYIHIEQETKATQAGVPPAYWPASGDIRVENLSARYSPDGPKVLQDISFHIKSGERVGVVGRTGSGKSSLTLSLLRCIYTEGTVYYDGLSTDSINLDALRSNITIIPQVPELLSGTLRQNLDPFSQYDDATLNDALRAAGLFSLQDETNESKITLDSSIASGGANLSVGQRQILALARAIVRGSKLLILDEATSATDYKTDTIIQASLRHELDRDVTLLTVAHRLQTIMDADKIMVLDAGRIVEFDSPKALLEKSDGMLRSLVDESGDRDVLYAMAQGSTAN